MSGPSDDPNALLGDLESIRTLLDAEEQPAASDMESDAASDDNVPMLDDVVDGAFELNEPADSTSPAISDDDSGVLDDETMRALLDDEWRARADALLGDARSDIESNSGLWQPEYTDQLAAALRVRIDGAVHDWISQTLADNVDGLRRSLIDALQQELDEQLKRHLGNNDGQ